MSMKEQTRRDILALCDAAARMRDAADEASEKHSEAFSALQRAEYYARKAVLAESGCSYVGITGGP